jgi:radical SAM protein with 4Fe4S-binding SPASM domain
MLFKIPYMYREELKQLLYKAITKEYRTYEQCNVPGNFCIILANGDVHPCNIHEYSHEPIIGNLFDCDMNIMNIMNNESSKHFQKDRSKYCSRCPIKINMCIRYE